MAFFAQSFFIHLLIKIKCVLFTNFYVVICFGQYFLPLFNIFSIVGEEFYKGTLSVTINVDDVGNANGIYKNFRNISGSPLTQAFFGFLYSLSGREAV